MRPKFTGQPEHQELWARLAAFEITPPSVALTFEGRLAREQGWSLDRAIAVTQEYRKFLFLLLTANHPVTPSEDVDAAWHLHLLYTRSYYEELCQQIAGRMIHHHPTAGGEAEQHKFFELYQRTLTLYEDWFGLPPADIWPDPHSRFASAGQGRWFNPTTHFLIPKPIEWLRRLFKLKK